MLKTWKERGRWGDALGGVFLMTKWLKGRKNPKKILCENSQNVFCNTNTVTSLIKVIRIGIL